MLDCHVSSNDKVRVAARNMILTTVDLSVAALHVQVAKKAGRVKRRAMNAPGEDAAISRSSLPALSCIIRALR